MGEPRRMLRRGMIVVLSGVLTGAMLVAMPSSQAAKRDRFYVYKNKSKLARAQPGDILRSRTLPYHFMGLPTQGKAIQLVFRTTDALGRQTNNAYDPSNRLVATTSSVSASATKR